MILSFYHAPLTSLVSIENTTNKVVALVMNWKITKNKTGLRENNLKFHLDGC
jgi:threonine aldolase